MPNSRPANPFPIAGINMETWLVRFDKNGICTSPKTSDALVANLAVKKGHPIIFFSHGWNNDFADAVDLYRKFLSEFEKVVAAGPIAGPSPIFVGVTWPSIWLPSVAGPQMAAGVNDPKSTSTDEAVLRELIDILPVTTDRSRLYALLETERLSSNELHELAGFLAPALRSSEEGPKEGDASETNIVNALTDIQRREAGQLENEDLDEIGVIGGGEVNDVAPAGLPNLFDPRSALRLASLYMMKDRAGKVGSAGVAALLRAILDQTVVPVHVVGHSFGCKVMLSAAVAAANPTRKLKSMLLLQPAVSHLSFATHVPGRDGPGGYRRVLECVERPILSTYSASDFPLHEIYHLALLRQKDLGEAQIAAGATRAGNPPNAYAALGGYGPRGTDEFLIDPIPRPGETFKYPNKVKLIGLDGSFEKRIDSHGGVANAYTAWALREQINS
jgi:hypothetical protein